MTEKAVFIGRFQPFHLGHQNVIEQYSDEYRLEIVIGSAKRSRTEKNPLNAEERKKIIQECHPETDISRKEDHESDRRWIQDLEEMTEADKVISQNSLVKKLVDKHTEMEVEAQKLFDDDIYSGTEIRRRIRSGEEWRYLVPDCAVQRIDNLEDVIKASGTQYEFEPGWKRENAFHGTNKE